MPVRFHPLYVVLAVVGVVLAAALVGPVRRAITRMAWPERRELLAVTGVGVLARALASPWGMAPVPDALWSRLTMTWGLNEPHPLYGPGLGVFGGIARKLTEAGPDSWFLAQMVAACVTPPLVWAAARALAGRTAALTAGLGMAVLPAHVLLSAGVLEQVTVTALTTGAVAAALSAQRQPSHVLGMLAGLLAGVAPQLRPEALALVPVVGLLLVLGPGARAGRIAGLLAMGGLVAWRLVLLGGAHTAQDVLGLTPMGPVDIAWDLSFGSTFIRSGDSKVLNVLGWVPLGAAWFWLLAVYGMTRLRQAWPALVWWAVLFGPMALRGEPLTDAIRFQLASLPAALVLAGVAVEALPRPDLTRFAPWALAGLSALFLPSVAEPWAPTLAFREMQAGLAQLPAHATPTTPEVDNYAFRHAELIGLLSRRVGPHRPRPVAAHDRLPSGEVWLWWPLLCTDLQMDGDWAPTFQADACTRFDACDLEPIHEARVHGRLDSKWSMPDDGVRVGWYRIRSCAPPAPWAADPADAARPAPLWP